MGESAFCRFLKGVPPTGLNQYGSVGGVSYSYDDNGTLIDDGTYLYYYDCENRLTGVDEEVSYKYDFAGRRVKKIASGNPDVITKYCYDGDQVIAEYDGSNTLLRRFVYGPGIDEPVCMIDVADSNAVYYYHYDGLGSVVALSDANGVIVERYKYDVFGQPMIIDPNNEQLTTSNYGNPYMFTGRRYDSEVGLYYYRFRYYRPEIGRFLQTDPIGYFAGLNLYTYVGNNPLNWLDPFGLCEKDKEKDTFHYHNLKEIEVLLGERFMGDMRRLEEELGEIPLDQKAGLFNYLFGDSIYFQGTNKNKLFKFREGIHKGSELNYYAIAMLLRRDGWSPYGAIGLTYSWKTINILPSYPAYWVGVYDKADIYHLPTRNELDLLIEGYVNYSGPIFKPTFQPDWVGSDGVYYR